jgi:dephospho-CoA kinase
VTAPGTASRTARTVRIGITGEIGCGKSQVARWLEALGCRVLDADRIARDVTAPGTPVQAEILHRFGASVAAPDGTLDRAALGRLVFADAGALRDLETIVHPAVRPVILGAIADAEQAGVPAVAVEAIKLVEGGLAALCDEVWLVTCHPTAQRDRLLARGTPAADAEQRMAAQQGLAERLRPFATRVLDTSGGLAESQELVEAALRAALAARATALAAQA